MTGPRPHFSPHSFVDLFYDLKKFVRNIEKRIPIIDAGNAIITPVANVATSLAITFNKVFETSPIVMVTANTSVIGATVQGVAVTGITTTGCTLWIYRTNTSVTNVLWMAYDPS